MAVCGCQLQTILNFETMQNTNIVTKAALRNNIADMKLWFGILGYMHFIAVFFHFIILALCLAVLVE